MTDANSCKRCNGTGREFNDTMICATCHGKGTTTEQICQECYHPIRMHSKLEHMNRLDCECESSSGQFICGCQGDGKVAKPICNVCGKDQGNSYCLNRHLGESPECKAKFEVQLYA